MAEFMENLEV